MAGKQSSSCCCSCCYCSCFCSCSCCCFCSYGCCFTTAATATGHAPLPLTAYQVHNYMLSLLLLPSPAHNLLLSPYSSTVYGINGASHSNPTPFLPTRTARVASLPSLFFKPCMTSCLCPCRSKCTRASWAANCRPSLWSQPAKRCPCYQIFW